ncbi:hypothetical protein Tco_0724844 [Tanacetum coccineum]|uniref:Uncharacterized protein n=1 Tax=Tanacetum coccineum TaxID=301880 RepID=A0ABQ4YCQ3_9ASTR
MSNTNNNLETQTLNALHNVIMKAGGKDRPPMLAPGNHNPPYKFKWTEKTVPIAEGSSETTIEGYMENYKNVSQDIRNQLDVEVVQIILTGIDNDIYSTVNACPNASESRIEDYLLPQLYDILKQHQNEVNEIRAERLARTANPLALVAQQQPAYHPNYYTQHSSTRSKQAATRNKEKQLSALFYQFMIKNLKCTSSNTSRAHQDNTPRINRGTGYDNQRVVNVAVSRENVGTHVVQQSRIQFYKHKEYRHVAKECQKLKWAKDAAYHKDKMLLCKQEEAGIQLNAEQANWRDDTDDEPEDQELKAHYLYMTKIQEVTPDDAENSGPIFDTEPLQKVQNDNDNYNMFANDREHLEQPESVNDTYLEEQGDTNITIDSLDMSNNGEMVDQDDDDLAKERDLLASLIEKLKCEIDDSKNRNKFLDSSNKTLIDKLKGEIEDFKTVDPFLTDLT